MLKGRRLRRPIIHETVPNSMAVAALSVARPMAFGCHRHGAQLSQRRDARAGVRRANWLGALAPGELSASFGLVLSTRRRPAYAQRRAGPRYHLGRDPGRR